MILAFEPSSLHDRAMGGLLGWHRLVGRWITAGPHPGVADEVVHGEATFEWLEDQRCLTLRTLYDHPDIPDALMVTAVVDGTPTMHYFDARGTHSVFEVEITAEAWRFWSDDPANARRWTGTFADGGKTIQGTFERCLDGVTWMTELEVTYRRV